MEWEKISANYVFNNGLMSKIYKELSRRWGRRWAWRVRTASGPEPGSPTAPAPATGRAPRPAPPYWVAVARGVPGSLGQAGAEVACVGGGEGVAGSGGGGGAVRFRRLCGASRSGAGGGMACYALCTFPALKPREHG